MQAQNYNGCYSAAVPGDISEMLPLWEKREELPSSLKFLWHQLQEAKINVAKSGFSFSNKSSRFVLKITFLRFCMVSKSTVFAVKGPGWTMFVRTSEA